MTDQTMPAGWLHLPTDYSSTPQPADIVDRLRCSVTKSGGIDVGAETLLDAANEIERLRAQLTVP